jgi:glycosyltransferase involved in cell wall biosynthesis
MDIQNTFSSSSKPHILMITNHGIHNWEINPGLPDTGGQNVFVNQFTAALAKEDFKITIVNRGGYPHPITGETYSGFHYKDDNQRILYLNDGFAEFVRKEDMDERLPHLAQTLIEQFAYEDTSVDLIISHYWDGAKLGFLYNRSLPKQVKHIWVPHSLGAVKKRNVKPERWGNLRVNERIENEEQLIKEIDAVAATSATIRQSLQKDYHYQSTPLFLPPCIDPKRYHPQIIQNDHTIWGFLSKHSGLTSQEVQDSLIITEISRTDITKRKDVLIKAFAQVNKKYPKTLLVITIDKNNFALAKELIALIQSLGIRKQVAVLGSVWEKLPDIYAVTDIYCTPSIMEGFGMTPQEAAATKVPVVSSNLVPFAMEYLLSDNIEEIPYQENTPALKVGRGAIVAPADHIGGFAHALEILIVNETLRNRMGESAYKITIPYFTWDHMVSVFLENINVSLDRQEQS